MKTPKELQEGYLYRVRLVEPANENDKIQFDFVVLGNHDDKKHPFSIQILNIKHSGYAEDFVDWVRNPGGTTCMKLQDLKDLKGIKIRRLRKINTDMIKLLYGDNEHEENT